MSRLWAITTFFNPSGYRRRIENYRIFRQRLTVPLATAELSFSGEFTLGSDDADLLVQLKHGDAMWQKERLLNVLLSHLPTECDQVAWLDCDVIFEAQDWAHQASKALEHCRLLQLFDQRVFLPADALPEYDGDFTDPPVMSIMHALAHGRPVDVYLSQSIDVNRVATGLAFGAPRSLLESHGLYDGCILGGGDRALIGAALGLTRPVVQFHQMNTVQQSRYAAWAQRFESAVGGNWGYLPGKLFHLWHGSAKHRSHTTRQQILTSNHFDPAVDIRVNREGAWEWATDKPMLHEQVRGYFDSRKEDA